MRRELLITVSVRDHRLAYCVGIHATVSNDGRCKLKSFFYTSTSDTALLVSANTRRHTRSHTRPHTRPHTHLKGVCSVSPCRLVLAKGESRLCTRRALSDERGDVCRIRVFFSDRRPSKKTPRGASQCMINSAREREQKCGRHLWDLRVCAARRRMRSRQIAAVQALPR